MAAASCRSAFPATDSQQDCATHDDILQFAFFTLQFAMNCRTLVKTFHDIPVSQSAAPPRVTTPSIRLVAETAIGPRPFSAGPHGPATTEAACKQAANVAPHERAVMKARTRTVSLAIATARLQDLGTGGHERTEWIGEH